jgi:hypothetical protein
MDAHSEQELPLIFEGAGDGGTAAEFAASERPRLRAQLADKGALLLRGSPSRGRWVDEFDHFHNTTLPADIRTGLQGWGT